MIEFESGRGATVQPAPGARLPAAAQCGTSVDARAQALALARVIAHGLVHQLVDAKELADRPPREAADLVAARAGQLRLSRFTPVSERQRRLRRAPGS